MEFGDSLAVKNLLDRTEQRSQTICWNWRASQQVALSEVEEYEKNNGLFELRYVWCERYLPFNATGAVSNWR